MRRAENFGKKLYDGLYLCVLGVSGAVLQDNNDDFAGSGSGARHRCTVFRHSSAAADPRVLSSRAGPPGAAQAEACSAMHPRTSPDS